jgi:hypothetical protein
MLCTQDADDPHNIIGETICSDEDKEDDDDIPNDAMEPEKTDDQAEHAYKIFKVCTVARIAFKCRL